MPPTTPERERVHALYHKTPSTRGRIIGRRCSGLTFSLISQLENTPESTLRGIVKEGKQ